MAGPELLTSVATAVERILERTDAAIVAAAPLALGKPNRLINALYARVKAAPARSLVLMTALSLARPVPKPGLEARFAQPFLDRHFGDYEELDYVLDRRAGRLPANVRVREFYLQSGAWLGNADAQRDYASINYTHVAREVAARGVNLLVQLVARRGDRLSLSCNTDVTLDLLERLGRTGRPRPYVVAVVHPDLPFLGNDAEVGLDFADLVLDDGAAPRLFALPRGKVVRAEHALGLHASTLVADGGTLQIGIGALSDALVHALLLRQRDNETYRGMVGALWRGPEPAIVGSDGGTAPLARGLYGASEMVMDGFMALRRAGVLTRRVFDDLALQTLLNRGVLHEALDGATLDRLLEAGLVPTALDVPAIAWLVRFGFLPAGTTVSGGRVRFADGTETGADLLDHGARAALAQRIAGRRLRGGHYLNGAFYLGSTALYEWLRTLDGEEFDGLGMTRVAYINELYGGRELLDVAQRRQARFFNTCMMHTLLGAAVSDALESGHVVSGVGGQYNFVAMAHALPDGRSVLMLRATRDTSAGPRSSVLWSYGHATIPRHLRDLVVTEYGVADLRGATDEECIERMLAISDARFHDALVGDAQRAGKLRRDYVVPDAARANTPAALADALRPFERQGLLPEFPLGCDFTPVEQRLLPALDSLKAAGATRRARAKLLWRALAGGTPQATHAEPLARLGLDRPVTARERILQRVVVRALRDVEEGT